MTFEPAIHQLAFVLPLSFCKGDVTFCPRTDGPDVWCAICPSSRPRHVVSTAQLTQGKWLARLQWSDGRHRYYEEKEIVIEPIQT